MTAYLIEKLAQADCAGCLEAAEELARLREIRHEQRELLSRMDKAYRSLRARFEAETGQRLKRRRKRRSLETRGQERHSEALQRFIKGRQG